MTNLPRWSLAGLISVLVLWQASSCCCCLGGAVTPPMTPFPTSGDLAQDMRGRIMQAKSEPGPFDIEVSDQELTSYVVGLLQSGAGEFPARDMQIVFGDGYVELWATFIEVAPTDVPTYVRMTVEAVDGQLVFYIVQANAGVFPVPGATREALSQMMSETLSDLQLGLWVEEVAVSPGKMALTGQVTGEIPDLP